LTLPTMKTPNLSMEVAEKLVCEKNKL